MRKIYQTFAIVFTLLLVNCSDETMEQLSSDPNNPEKVSPTLLLTAAQIDVLGDFGYNWDRYAGAFVQTFAGNHATGVNVDQYNLQAQDFQTAFTGLYVGGMKDCYELINTQGPAAGAWHHVGVAKIIMATGLGYLTDIYGDIPYSEAFKLKDGILNPVYDKQENVYESINTLLLGAIEDLEKEAILPLDGDLVHDNNLSKWKATAYLLLARYANHLSKVNPQGSADLALSYVDQAKAEGLNNNSWNYAMPYDPDDSNWRNPWFELYQNNLIIASENFMNMLTNSDYGSWDPRLYSYWNTESVDGTFVDFSGKQNGLPTGSESYSPVGPDGYYGKQESPLLIATHFELLFIEAEAAMRASTPDLSRAATAFNGALNSQINLVTLSGVEHFMHYSSVDESTATNVLNTKINDYITYNQRTANTITLEHVMTEKYKAMFTMNAETWVDLRRHNFSYPGYLALPANAVLGNFVRRALYTQSEIQNNTNVPQQLTMLDRLWWDM